MPKAFLKVFKDTLKKQKNCKASEVLLFRLTSFSCHNFLDNFSCLFLDFEQKLSNVWSFSSSFSAFLLSDPCICQSVSLLVVDVLSQIFNRYNRTLVTLQKELLLDFLIFLLWFFFNLPRLYLSYESGEYGFGIQAKVKIIQYELKFCDWNVKTFNIAYSRVFWIFNFIDVFSLESMKQDLGWCTFFFANDVENTLIILSVWKLFWFL